MACSVILLGHVYEQSDSRDVNVYNGISSDLFIMTRELGPFQKGMRPLSDKNSSSFRNKAQRSVFLTGYDFVNAFYHIFGSASLI